MARAETAALTAAVDPANRRRGVLMAARYCLRAARRAQLDAFRRWPDDDPVTRHVLPWNTLSDDTSRHRSRSLSRRRRNARRRLPIGSRPRIVLTALGSGNTNPTVVDAVQRTCPGRSHRGGLDRVPEGPLDRLLCAEAAVDDDLQTAGAIPRLTPCVPRKPGVPHRSNW